MLFGTELVTRYPYILAENMHQRHIIHRSTLLKPQSRSGDKVLRI